MRYARVRVDWQLADAVGRREMEVSRGRCHDAFIARCDALARGCDRAGTDATSRDRLGRDRRRIGDFACHLHSLLALAAR